MFKGIISYIIETSMGDYPKQTNKPTRNNKHQRLVLGSHYQEVGEDHLVTCRDNSLELVFEFGLSG